MQMDAYNAQRKEWFLQDQRCDEDIATDKYLQECMDEYWDKKFDQ